jgi:hypothetical protein
MSVLIGSSNLSSVPMFPSIDGYTPWACSQVNPCPCPNVTQVSINHSKESEVCAPLVLHITIVHPRCSCPHPNIFVHPTNFFLPCSLRLFVVEYSQGVCTLGGCRGRPYVLPHSNLFSSSTTSFNFHGVSTYL